MMKLTGLLAALLLTSGLYAQEIKDKAIVNMLCGCFEVEFKYAETFSPIEGYKFHEREIISGGTELVFPVEQSDKRIVMQHLLVITDSIIIKHWREVWTYENPEILKYSGNKTWVKKQLAPNEVKGKWTQSIWEVSDEPRYQGIGEWLDIDGKIVWESTAYAPLPRREYSVRNDYNILKRTNRISLTEDGYRHDQDNEKIIRTDGTDKLLVAEKGLNAYKRIDSSACAPALFYWENNKIFWTKVRNIWADYIVQADTISMQTKVDGKVLHEYLFAMAKSFKQGKIKPTELDSLIKKHIEMFLKNANDVVRAKSTPSTILLANQKNGIAKQQLSIVPKTPKH